MISVVLFPLLILLVTPTIIDWLTSGRGSLLNNLVTPTIIDWLTSGRESLLNNLWCVYLGAQRYISLLVFIRLNLLACLFYYPGLSCFAGFISSYQVVFKPI